jgi:F-type H+-transporting ATP synthase subunit e
MLFLVQVVRYSALFSGVVYGILHRRTLQKEADAAKIDHAIHHREHLVSQAKEAWKQKQLAGKSDGGEYIHCLRPDVLGGWHLHSMPRRSTKPVLLGVHAVLTCLIVITDPEDPKFDIEKLVAKWEKDYA